MKEAKVHRKNITFLRGLGYIYLPIFIFLFSGYFIKDYDMSFVVLFFTIITLSYLLSYYLVNKTYSIIKTEKFIGMVIPLIFIISLILAIIFNNIFIL